LPAPAGVRRIEVETADQMLAASLAVANAGNALDAGIFVAAVADWRPDEAFGVKLKKGKDGPPNLRLTENRDILATLSAKGPQRPRLVIGFAAETNDVEAHARAKLARKGCDWIIANDVTEPGVMGGAENAVMIISHDGLERLPRAGKDLVAAEIAARIAKALED
jgi:phosphopantothenoylcysteine decarboxylase/phosphopantothenate--cysteine ligase